jgi:Fe-S cluster assembly protein SufB
MDTPNNTSQLNDQVKDTYAEKYGFSMPDTSLFKTPRGLSEDVVRQISSAKQEPAWMLDLRLKALRSFNKMPLPMWGADLTSIKFEDIYYYLKPTDTEKRNWEDVPAEIKNTFERLGVPQAEREYLAGVKAQYDSEVAYSSLISELEDQGVIFLSTDEA